MDFNDLALMMHEPRVRDPFAALLPFATGSSLLSAGKHRDMPIDVQETEKSIEVKADIPGVHKEDIKIDVDDNVLSVSVTQKAETEKTEEKEGVQWHHSERSSSFVKRSVRLPETADMDNIAAEYKDGVLAVSMPKREVPEKVKRIAIK